MAILAGIINTAAGHFDRNDVDRRMIMDAPGFGVDFHSSNFRHRQLHMPI